VENTVSENEARAKIESKIKRFDLIITVYYEGLALVSKFIGSDR
jgi:hypothetical protein